jgi:hypothetical protein
MLYAESKSAGSCGHFKFHTKRDATQIVLSKLTDPAKPGKFDNLSLEQLHLRISGDATAGDAER